MALLGITPQFSYNPGTGTVNFVPVFPPTKKPLSNQLSAVRHDSITTSGIKQSINERTDSFLTLLFEYVPTSDIAAWVLFMTWALPGGVFTYAPDSTVPGTNSQYTLEDTDWDPKRTTVGFATFQIKMRLFV